jgi:tRNA(adenine34) deaminase
MIDEIFMREAIKQAKLAADADEVPVGAIIVCGSQMLAKAHNQVETLKDPTAHAEMIAITQAANTLGSKWLHECTLYVTLEPCTMCVGALVLARIKRIVFGAYDPKTGACGSFVDLGHDRRFNHTIDIQGGILQNECGELLSRFFRGKRVKENNGPVQSN